MIIQLNPPIPLITPDGKGIAHFMIDYGVEHDLIWVVFLEDGEIWCFLNKDVRAVENLTIGGDNKSAIIPESKYVFEDNYRKIVRQTNDENGSIKYVESNKIKR